MLDPINHLEYEILEVTTQPGGSHQVLVKVTNSSTERGLGYGCRPFKVAPEQRKTVRLSAGWGDRYHVWFEEER